MLTMVSTGTESADGANYGTEGTNKETEASNNLANGDINREKNGNIGVEGAKNRANSTNNGP